jgi:hypothetical protein
VKGVPTMPVRTLLVSAVVAVGATFALATPAQACTGTVCATVNTVCIAVTGNPCAR